MAGYKYGREFVLNHLREIAEGHVIGIDYVPQYIESGDIKREEALPFLKKCFEKFVSTGKIEMTLDKLSKKYPDAIKGIKGEMGELLFDLMGFPEDQYKQAKKALKAIKRGKPVYFRGHTI